MSIRPVSGGNRLMNNPKIGGTNIGFTSLISIRSDRNFRAALGSFTDFSELIPNDNPLHRIKKLPQSSPHQGIDPLEHTFNALKLLSGDDISVVVGDNSAQFKRPLFELARIAMIFHDVGKVYNPLDPNHPLESANIARETLKDPFVSGVGELNDAEMDFICFLIKTHHFFGDILKQHLSGKLHLDDIAKKIQDTFGAVEHGALSVKDLFYVHLKISLADIESIPGLKETISVGRDVLIGTFLDLCINFKSSSKTFSKELAYLTLSPEDIRPKDIKPGRKKKKGKVVLKNREKEKVAGALRNAQHIRHFVNMLLGKIKTEIFAVKLRFTKDAVIYMCEEKETEFKYKDGAFMARAFLRAGISGLSLKEYPNKVEIGQFEQVLRAADEGNILDINPDKLRQLSVIENFDEITLEQGKILSIPGFFKHYTSESGFRQIVEQGRIKALPHKKNGHVKREVFLTDKSLSAEEVFNILMLRDPAYRGSSTHVIGFDILDPEFKKKIKKRSSLEYSAEFDIDLGDPRVRVMFVGENMMQ